MNQSFKLYSFQKHIAKLLLIEKRNVILQAPTGAGKTLAALLPFLNAFDHGYDFPRKCIYSVPMRILANQFVLEYEAAVKHAGREDRIEVAIQTGDQPDDRELAANLIFATIDQTLSSYLNAPYGLPKSRANLNAGAVMSSYLVFDEFHFFDPKTTLPTTLQMLKDLKGITPFVLMTATFSTDMLAGLADELDAVVVPDNETEQQWFVDLKSQQKTRRYHAASEPLTAEYVLHQHHAITDDQKRTLVICNTIARAQTMYETLVENIGDETEVHLLHSRFLPDDRSRIEDTIRSRFGKDDASGGSLIAVATQAIEVGVDITSQVMHTELAPANAILQRAGRCARYEGNVGDVYIYREVIEDGETVDLCDNPMPYKEQADLFPRTWDAFGEYNHSTLDFAAEQAIITDVHGDQDEQTLEALTMMSHQYRGQIQEVMRSCEKSAAKRLIRDIDSMRVTIHSDPQALGDDPYAVPAFSIHRRGLLKYVGAWLQQFHDSEDTEAKHAVWYMKAYDDSDGEKGTQITFYSEKAEATGDVIGSPLVIVCPEFAAYDEKIGFQPYRGDYPIKDLDWTPLQPEDKRDKPSYSYRLETYQTHIEYVYHAFEEYWSELEWAARQLEERFDILEEGDVEKAAQFAVLLHDVGKLSMGWQTWAHRYQAAIGEAGDPDEAYAHTDWDKRNSAHVAAEKKVRPKRPHHAIESAVAVAPMLVEAFGSWEHPLVSAVFSAIARHHTATADELRQDLRLVAAAREHLLSVGDDLPAGTDIFGLDEDFSSDDGRDMCEALISNPDNDEATYLAYRLIVRVLRRADGTGTHWGSIGHRIDT